MTNDFWYALGHRCWTSCFLCTCILCV